MLCVVAQALIPSVKLGEAVHVVSVGADAAGQGVQDDEESAVGPYSRAALEQGLCCLAAAFRGQPDLAVCMYVCVDLVLVHFLPGLA